MPPLEARTLEAVHPGWRDRLRGLMAEAGCSLNSVWRSRSLQECWFRCARNNCTGCPQGHRCHGSPGNCPSANPGGTSNHEYEEGGVPAAFAVDLAGNLTAARRLAAKYGCHFPIAREGWHCVDAETEILSNKGWKGPEAIAEGDAVLTLNPLTMLAEWQPMLAVIRKPARPRRMLSMEGQTHSSLTTAEHRWCVLRQGYEAGRRGSRYLSFRTPAGGFGAEDQLVRCAPVAGAISVQKYEDAVVELVAWYWTEGTDYNSAQVGLYQSATANPSHVVRIRRALMDAFGPPVSSLRPGRFLSEPAWREDTHYRRRGRATAEVEADVHFRLNSVAGAILRGLAPERVPSIEFVGALTESQLRLLLDVSILGDGNEYGTRRFLSQARKEPLDVMQMVATMLGIPTHLRSQSGKPLWVLSLLSQGATAVSSLRREWVDHEGPVWCVTTPNETWLARRRGTVYFTGNCQPVEVVGSAMPARSPFPPVASYGPVQPPPDPWAGLEVPVLFANH